VAQRLARKVCDRCMTLDDVSSEERLAYELEMGNSPARFARGQGCNFCVETGYHGRTGVFEVLTMSEAIRRLLMKSASADEIKAQAMAEGMMTMWRDGMLKVRDGMTTVREVMRNVYTIK
jgi:general secretion pathway protein E